MAIHYHGNDTASIGEKRRLWGTTLFHFQGYKIAPGGQITKFIRIGGETFASKKGRPSTLITTIISAAST